MSNLNVDNLNISSRLSLPNYTSAQRTALTSVATGTLIYNTTDEVVEIYDGTAWMKATSSGAIDGSSPTSAALTVTELKNNGVTNDGIYWYKDAGGATYQAFTLMNSAYDGGGWVLLYNIVGSSANSSVGGHPHWDNTQFWTTPNEQNQTAANASASNVKTRAFDKYAANEFLIVINNKTGYATNSVRGWSVYTNNNFSGQTYLQITNSGNNRVISTSGRKTWQNYVGNLTWNSRRPNSRGGDPFIDGTVNGNNNASDNLVINATGYWGSQINNTRLTTTAGSGNSTYGHSTSGIGIRHQFGGWGFYASWTPIQAYCEPPAIYSTSSTEANNYTGSPESGSQIHLSCGERGWANGFIDAAISVFVR